MAKLNTLVQNQLADINRAVRGARGWFRSKVEQIKGTTAKTLMANKEWHRGLPEIGGMYAYFYDPKTKDNLPYFDIFPVTIVIEKYNDGFLGLNLHYLPPMYRLGLLDKLMEYATDNELTETTKLRLTYSLLRSASKIKEAQPCIKRYLYSHVQSRFLMIPATEWEKVIFLNVESFKKKGKSVAWSDSLTKIR